MKITLKEITSEDIDLLFAWVNDEVVRKSSFNSNMIKYCEHKAWFYRKLQSSDCKIYIGYFNETPIGQVRIDFEKNIAVIDYSVDKHYRGKGYGTSLLDALTGKVSESNWHVNKIIGKVKTSNFSSQRAFEKAGFLKKVEDEVIIYYKDIGGFYNE